MIGRIKSPTVDPPSSRFTPGDIAFISRSISMLKLSRETNPDKALGPSKDYQEIPIPTLTDVLNK